MGQNGVSHSAASDISLIRNVLLEGAGKSDQLDPYFALKELIQNADDAGARSLTLGWTPGLPGAAHPLLRGPAIYALNDGSFSAKDAVAIRGIGASAKLADSRSVGKFGLGLKTAFYFCEALFYQASPAGGLTAAQRAGILNIWDSRDDLEAGNTAHRTDWDSLPFAPEDRALVADSLGRRADEPWFVAWLPLRRAEHCRRAGTTVAIYESFWGDNPDAGRSILAEGTGSRLGDLLPLLGSIRRVDVVTDRGGESFELCPPFRPLPRRDPALGRSGLFGGHLRLAGEEGWYSGYERVVAKAGELRDSPKWPTVLSGTVAVIPEKAEPHAAVLLTARGCEPGKGSLSLQWAVFLPITGEAEGPIPTGGDRHYMLTFHGYFFLSPDRRRVMSWEGVDQSIRAEWNRHLAEDGALGSLLLGLSHLVSRGLPDKETWRLTSSLQGSKTFARHCGAICAERSWLYRLGDGGLGGWTVWEADDPFFEVPAGAGSPTELPPILSSLSAKVALTPAAFPRLSAHPARQWTAPMLIEVMNSFKEGEHPAEGLELICKLVSDVSDPPAKSSQGVRDALKALLRRIFLRFKEDALRGMPQVGGLLNLLPLDEVLVLPGGLGAELRDRLLALETDCLLVPAGLRPPDGRELIGAGDALAVLRLLAGQPLEGFVLRLLGACREPERARLMDGCRDLPLFRLREMAGGLQSDMAASLNGLSRLAAEGRLFALQATQTRGTLEALSKALGPDERLGVADSQVGAYLDPPAKLGGCDEAAVARTLLSAPPLAGTAARGDLLGKLRSSGPDDREVVLAMRYLLHADPDRIRDESVLYAGGPDGHSLWARLAREIVGEGGSWRFVEAGLADLLNRVQRQGLDVAEMDAAGVEALLGERGPQSLPAGLDPDDRGRIIREFKSDALLRTLPIYETEAGGLVAITGRVYAAGGFPASPGLLAEAGVTLLAQPAFPDLSDRLRRLAPPLTPLEAIQLALGARDPSAFAGDILDAIRMLPTLPPDLAAELRQVRWLPLWGGGACAPDGVLRLDGLDGLVEEILNESGAGVVASSQLTPEVTGHLGFSALKEFLPGRGEAVETLGGIMGGLERYHVGGVDLGGPGALDDWLFAFQGETAAQMPAAAVLRALDVDAPRLLRALQKGLPPARTLGVLGALVARHKAVPLKERPRVLNTFNAYLRAARSGEWKAVRTGIELLSQTGEWKPLDRLAHGAANISPSDLVDPDQGEIVQGNTPAVSTPEAAKVGQVSLNLSDLEAEIEGSVAELEDYFAAWEGHVERSEIGGLLGLMGRHHRIQELADRYLRSSLGFLGRVEFPQWIGGTNYPDLDGALKDVWVVVERVSPGTVTVLNLLGERLEATVRTDPESLWVGREVTRPVPGADGIYCTKLRMLDLDPASVDGRRLLRESARQLHRKVFNQLPGNFDEAWAELSKTDQLDVRVAQGLILEGAFLYLKGQVGIKIPLESPLGRVFQEWDAARVEQQEYEQLRQEGKRPSRGDPAERIKSSQRKLRELLEADPGTQALCLAGVRRKLTQARYKPGSVPFELCQNADDAYAELAKLGAPVPPDAPVEVHLEGGVFRFMHWGRRINQFAWGREDGRDRGHHRDLEKMLVLNASDKDAGVTGKFGLGFKSVLLVTDRPRVASGSLGFEVLGGVYPRRLRGEELSALVTLLEDPTAGTVIELEVAGTQGHEELERSLTREFADWSSVMLAFTRRVKRLALRALGRADAVRWLETAVEGVPGASVGSADGGPAWLRRALLLRSGEVAVLLKVDGGGVRPLPDTVPTVWVTAPTEEAAGVGFAINGPFALDVGRARLDASAAGHEAATRLIGEGFGRQLISLFDLGWPELARQLGLGSLSGTGERTFWESVWELLGCGVHRLGDGASVPRLLRALLWGGAGLGHLYRSREALPTLLSGAHDRLTSAGRVRRAALGVLDDRAVFEKVQAWPAFAGTHLPGTVVSAGRVGEALESLAGQRLEPLTLKDALEAELPGRECPPELAGTLGGLVTPAFVRDGLTPQDQGAVQGFLRLLRFRAADGSFQPANFLLVPSNSRDEELRSGFAPPSRVLDGAYDGPALEFFRACRERLEVAPVTVAGWVLEARAETRDAALRYLLQGDPSREVVRLLRDGQAGTWLSRVTEADLERLGATAAQGVLAWLDRPGATPPAFPAAAPYTPYTPYAPPHPDPAPPPNDWPARLSAWWKAKGGLLLERYDTDLYPQWAGRLGPEDGAAPRRPEGRRRWLVALMLGAMQTLGRARPTQHRGFLQLCHDRGWLEVFENRGPTANEWVQILRDYIDGDYLGLEDHRYYHWMRLYPAIYQIAHWLDDYVEVLLDLGRVDGSIVLRSFLDPRSSPRFQGGGASPPSLVRALGLGAHFVVREMARGGLIRSEAARRLAYVPSGRVRRLLDRLGHQGPGGASHEDRARAIHGFLSERFPDDPTLDGSFDIPLIWLSDDAPKTDQARHFRSTVFGADFEDLGDESEED